MSSNGNGNAPRVPQAPPHLPPSSSTSSSSRTRSTSFDTKPDVPVAKPPEQTSRSARSQQRKSARTRAASDGVRMMRQQFYEQQQQQQQQQYWNPYQMPVPYMNPQGFPPQPPQGFPPVRKSASHSHGGEERKRRTEHARSFTSEGIQQPLYGSFASALPPSHHLSMRFAPQQQLQPPPNSFSGFNELSSIMGNRSLRKNQSMGPGGRTSFHRRSASESAAPMAPFMPLPPLMSSIPQNEPLDPVMMQQHQRVGSFSSHHSYHSTTGNGNGSGGETHPFLRPNNNSHSSARKSRSHMRQASINLYMNNYRGKEQPRSCRDATFAILFLLQLAITSFLGLRYGPDALVSTSDELGPSLGLNDDDDNVTTSAPPHPPNDTDDTSPPLVLAYWNIVQMAYTCGAFAVIISASALAFMMAMSRRLVYVALVLSIGVSFAWGTIGIGISPKSFVPITGIIALMLTVGYMFVVWDRIPFASANLTTALVGVRDHLGLVGIAFECQFLALVCSIYYSFTFAGLHNAMCNGGVVMGENWKILVDCLLLVSYYWTYQVLRHIVIVTVAGTIGSWWFKKPSALYSTFLQATVFNFGSICYGSLFVGFVQLLRQFTEGLRPNRDDSAMMCLYECGIFFQERIVGCVDHLADSFTPWAFTYVGLYRYGLKEAGHKANELFEKRGWSRIVTDDLVPTVLAMVSLVIGGLTGSFAVILQAISACTTFHSQNWFSHWNRPLHSLVQHHRKFRRRSDSMLCGKPGGISSELPRTQS